MSIAARADVEAPSFTGSPFNGTMGADARDVRLTMRDVVLMHVEDGLSVLDEGQAVYDVNLEVPLLGNTINFDRGYQWVDVRAGAQRFRFVNTHFEAFSSDIASRRPRSCWTRRRPRDAPRRSSSATATPTRSTAASSRRTRSRTGRRTG